MSANLRTPFSHLANKSIVDPHVLLNIEPTLMRLDAKVSSALSQLTDQIYLPHTDRFLRTRFDYGFLAAEDLKEHQRNVVEQLLKSVSAACDSALTQIQRHNADFADSFDAAAEKDYDLTAEQQNYTRKRMQCVVFDRIAQFQESQTKLQEAEFEKTMHRHFLNFKLTIDTEKSPSATRKQSLTKMRGEQTENLRMLEVDRTKGRCRDSPWQEIKDEARETLNTQSSNQYHNPFEDNQEPQESDQEMGITDSKLKEIEENQPKRNEPNSRDMEEESMKIPEDIAPKLSPEGLEKLTASFAENRVKVQVEEVVLSETNEGTLV